MNVNMVIDQYLLFYLKPFRLELFYSLINIAVVFKLTLYVYLFLSLGRSEVRKLGNEQLIYALM